MYEQYTFEWIESTICVSWFLDIPYGIDFSMFPNTAFVHIATFYCVEIGIVIYSLLCEIDEY